MPVLKVKKDGEWLNVNGGSAGVTSWNDLTDKPFYENCVVESVYFEEQTLPLKECGDLSYDSKRTVKSFYEDNTGTISSESLELGGTYRVTLDGVEYVCEAYMGGFDVTVGEYDASDLDFKETIEYPFSASRDGIYIATEADSATVKIEKVTCDIKQLDSKFVGADIARNTDVLTMIKEALSEFTNVAEVGA